MLDNYGIGAFRVAKTERVIILTEDQFSSAYRTALKRSEYASGFAQIPQVSARIGHKFKFVGGIHYRFAADGPAL